MADQITDGQVPAAPSQVDASAEKEPFDADRAMRTIEKLRGYEKEAGQTKKERDALAAELQKYKDAAKTDAELKEERLVKAERERDALAAEKQRLTIERAVILAVAASDARYPDLVASEIQKAKLELEDDGTPTRDSLKKALEHVRADYPELFKPAQTADNQPKVPQVSTGGSMNVDRATQQRAAIDPRNPPKLTDSGLWDNPRKARQ